MLLETLSTPWNKLLAANSTSASFASRVPTLIEPTGGGVIDASSPGIVGQNGLVLRFFGTDTNDETFNARILGWSQTKVSGINLCWDFILLAQFQLTLGNLAGTAGCAITATDFEADTISITYGNEDVTLAVVTPGNDVRGAYAVVDLMGALKAEILFDMNSSAVSANCLWRKV